MRGFISGLAIGLVTLALAIVALTLLSPAPRHPTVSDKAPQSASGGEPVETGQTDAQSSVSAPGTDSDLVELPPTAPTSPTGQENRQDDLNSLSGADTKPADKPNVGEVAAGLTDPAGAPQVPDVAAGKEAPLTAPVTAPAPSQAPGAPQDDNQPAAVSNPKQPSVPDVEQTGTELGSGPARDDTSPEITTAVDPVPSSDGGVAVTPAPGAEQAPDPSTEAAAAPTPAPTPAPAGTNAPSAPQTSTAPASPPAPVDAQESPGPQIAALPQAGADTGTSRTGVGKPVVPLTERDDPAETPDVATDKMPAPAAGPKIEANAEAFENPDNRPLMSIVLIDDEAGFGAEALAEFPYPLTFAVDPSDPQAAQKMARHRAAGFEVVALVDLPGDATAQDAEVNLSVWLETLPQVVALLEGTGSGVQGNRDLSDQVTEIVTGAGLGLIMQAKGLNTAYKLAARDGVPAALVFRDFDGAGQSPDVIRRFLDQAAFRAGQQGGVVMLGRLRPDTISALLIWGLQDRASRVALAPVSAVLAQ